MWTPTESYFYTTDDFNIFIKQNEHRQVNIKACLIKHCEANSILLYNIIKTFIENIEKLDINILKYSYSISSYSVNYYFSKHNNIQKKINKNLDNIIRDAYYGGRCEVFGNSLKNEFVYHFDFRGMYSICMKEKLPTKNFHYSELSIVSEPGFYKITFSSNINIPVLPVKTDLLYFPNGTYTGIYWYEEILLFLEHGGIINKVHFAILCDIDYCLLDFSNEIEKFRNTNQCSNIVGKLIINTFYGRLGAKDIGYKDVVSSEPMVDAFSYISINDVYINKIKTNSSGINNIAVAAAITSIARIKLYKTFIDVIKNGGRLLYSDTDSVFAAFNNDVVLDKLFYSGLFFDSKKNTTIIKNSFFADTKTYSIVYNNNAQITKIRGLPTNTINFSTFINIFFKKKILNYITQPILYKKTYSYKINIIKKNILINNYKKRVFLKNYTHTIPLKVLTINSKY